MRILLVLMVMCLATDASAQISLRRSAVPEQAAPDLEITTDATLPPATNGEDYSVTLAATGGTPEYTWSIPDIFTGTTRWVCADAANDTCGGQPDYATFSSAITAATCTDIIRLKANETFTGNFTLTDKNSGAYCPILITTTATSGTLPTPGQRLIPTGAVCITEGYCTANTDPTLLPKIRGTQTSGSQNLPAILWAAGANGWVLHLLEIQNNFNGSASAIRVGQNTLADQPNRASQPDNAIVDQVFWNLDGPHPYWGQKRAIELHSKLGILTNSYIQGANSSDTDSNTVWGNNGEGPFLISNNWIRGTTEQIITGGDKPHQSVIARVTGTPTVDGASLTWGSELNPLGDCPFVGQPIAVSHTGATNRAHPFVTSVTDCTATTATVTWAPSMSAVPDNPGDVRWGVIPGNCAYRTTAPCGRGAIIQYNQMSRDLAWRVAGIVPTPTNPVVTAGAGGSLAADTYDIRIAARLTSQGQAVTSAATDAVTRTVGASGSVAWSVDAGHADITTYRVYLTASGTTRYTDFASNSGTVTADGTIGSVEVAEDWQLKNIFEIKLSVDFLVRYNDMFNSWATAAGDGNAMWIKATNQQATSVNNNHPWAENTGTVIEYNVVRSTPAFFKSNGWEFENGTNYSRPRGTHGLIVRNNLGYDISNITYGGSGADSFFLGSGCNLCTFVHNTVDFTGNGFTIEPDGSNNSQLFLTDFVFKDNMVTRRNSSGGIKGAGVAEGTATLNSTEGCNCSGLYTFTNNIFGNSASGPNPVSQPYPDGNTFTPYATWQSQFTTPGGGSIEAYELAVASAYNDAGTDGHDIGVENIPLLAAEIAKTRTGIRTSAASYRLGVGACAGLEITTEGVIHGTPLYSGACVISITVTDSAMDTDVVEFTINVS